MRAGKLKVTMAALAIVAVGLIGASSASAATKTTTYPTTCGAMICTFPLASVWPQSVAYEGVTCALPGVTCPTANASRAAYQGRFAPAVNFSGVASVAATVVHTLTTPGPFTTPTQVFPGARFLYAGAGGSNPDSVTFTIDRAALNQSLIDLGGSMTMSVYLDDLDAGTTVTVVDGRPITNSTSFATDPTVSVDPSQLAMGHTYNARVVTRASFPVGVLPNATVYYRDFKLTATAEDTDDDGVADNGDNCPNASNPGQEDTDGDGDGDACDSTPNGDNDGDGVDNNSDNCPTDPNPAQTDTDGDGAGDACDPTPNGDTDGDGVDNNTDNCPGVANSDQADLDGDGQGDVCDGDIDGDGTPNGTDPDPRDPNVPAAGGGVLGAAAGPDKVRLRVKCPRSAERSKCKVKAVGRLSRGGPKVTNVVKAKVKRGKRRTITLRVKPQFLSQAIAADRVLVLRFVKKDLGKTRGKRKYVARPLVP